MKRIEKWAAILNIVKYCKDEDIKIGHTFIQKLIYLVQEAFDCQMGYNFKMHYYGPYSEDLWGDLCFLDDHSLLSVNANPSGCGYLIDLGTEQDWIAKQNFVLPAKIETLIEFLKNRKVKDLELLATTYYTYSHIKKRSKEVYQDKVENFVIQMKPHFTKDDIGQALLELEKNETIKIEVLQTR